MKQIILYILLSLLFLSSCNHDPEVLGMADEEVYLSVSTRVLDPSMTQVRIIVTDDLSGQVLINQYPMQPEPSGEYKLSVRTGQLNFYMVLNEPTDLTRNLSAISHQSALSSLILNGADLPTTEPVDNSTSQTNLPAMGWAKVLVRATTEGSGHGEGSVNGGSTWSNTINIQMQRMAAKVTLALRKQTQGAADEMTITKITAVNIPQYEYFLPKKYDSQQFDEQQVYDTPLLLSDNTDNYYDVFADYVIPEYLLVNPSDKDMAVCLKIEAEYKNRKVLYYLPVRGDLSKEDYSLQRNNHYLIRATIATEGETIYIPEVKYQVVDWTSAGSDSDFLDETAITFSRRWESGADIDGTNIHVRGNSYVEFHFTLSGPKGSTWAATLTNGIDFVFDETDGAVSSGVAREGHEYKIRIKPRRETQLNNIKSEFFITVNNGKGNVELNLPSESVGTKSRYTIMQIPD